MSTWTYVIANALRGRRIDITTTTEAGLLGADDVDQLAHCRRERRVIVTDDYDFLRSAAVSTDHAGIAFCDKRTRTLAQIIDGLMLIHGVLTADDMAGHVEYL